VAHIITASGQAVSFAGQGLHLRLTLELVKEFLTARERM